MADVIVKNKKTGIERVMPERSYQQLINLWTFVRYADDPNGQKKEEGKESSAKDAGDKFIFPDDLPETPDVANETDTDLLALQEEFRSLTGEEPGKKGVKRLQAEINKIKGNEG